MSVGLQKHWYQQPRSVERLPLASLTCAGALLLGVVLASSQTTISSTSSREPGLSAVTTGSAAAVAEAAPRFGENGGDKKSDAKIAPTEKATEKSKEKTKADGERQREGVEIVEQAGAFKVTGDRVLFVTAGEPSRSFVVLENLSLERIAREMDEGAETAEWTVSGSVTEFKGANYLIITHAVQKNGRSESKK